MIFHCSISAEQPEPVARMVAALWCGEAHPFPPLEGAWIALACDERGTAMEVHPFGVEMVPGETEVDYEHNLAPSRHSTSHQAIGTPLSEKEVLSLASAAGWRAQRCNRGPFDVVEVWLENRILIEVLTPEMQRQYLAFMTPANWREFVAEQQGA